MCNEILKCQGFIKEVGTDSSIKYYLLENLERLSDVNNSPSLSSSSLFSKFYVSEGISALECDILCRDTVGCYGSQFEYTTIESSSTDFFGNPTVIPAIGRCSFSYNKFEVNQLVDTTEKKNYLSSYTLNFLNSIYNGIYTSINIDIIRTLCEEICNSRSDCLGYNFLITRECIFGDIFNPENNCNADDVGQCRIILSFDPSNVESSFSRNRIYMREQLADSVVTINPQFNDVSGNLNYNYTFYT